MTVIAILQDLGVDRGKVHGIASDLVGPCELRWVTDPGPTAERAAGADVIVTVNAPVDRDTLASVRPRLVAVSFTGTDHVDLAAARELGVAVTNVPSYATDSVAELTVCAIIALMRRVTDCDRAVREGRWREGLTGTQLAGKTVGIVGTGTIGVAVARRLAAFECKLLGFSRSPSDAFASLGGEAVSLDELLARSDVVTLHVPLTDATRRLVGERELALMKPGALLVNAARGPVVDTAALAASLARGHLGGAAVDVYDVEPVPADNPLLSAPGTLLMPHVAFATHEALERKARITFECIGAFFGDRRLNRVDGGETSRTS